MPEQAPQAPKIDMVQEGVASRVPIWGLVRYYLHLGALGFGGPVALVGRMERALVGERKWLTREEMREALAVAIGMISPGPVVITATFVGAIVAGFWGSLAATVGIFLPSFLFVLIVALLSLVVLFRWNVNNPALVAVAAIIGLIAFPLLQPTWVFVK